MKILIDSYNTVKQNISGGVQNRIENFIKHSRNTDIQITLFNKWVHKITDYDVLHIFKVNIESYQLMLHAKNLDIPIVISSVVPLEHKYKILINRFLNKLTPFHTSYYFIEQMLSNADAVIAQTILEANFIEKWYKVDKNKIHIIPNGVSVAEEKNEQIFDKIGLDKPYILQVGRFDENKNQLNVIKAMAKTDVPVVFIGGPDSKSQDYYDKCKKYATKNMFFLGWLTYDDILLKSAYCNAKVVVLPSHKEIFGNSLIEGGAYGANLVSTNELPIKEWGINDICSTIDSNDINDINKKLIQAYNQSLNPNTSLLIKGKFSWDAVISEYVSIYDRIKKND